MSLNKSQAQKIKSLMMASKSPAYFVVNTNMDLLVWSDSLEDYGYSGMEHGVDATNIFDFLVGFNDVEKLELPLVDMPNGAHASVSLLREGDEINVLILDATHDFELSYLLQQKANDAQLLNYRLQALLKELVDTQKELEVKNQQLAEASLLQTKFLSGVSHEFRTPLTAILGYAEVLMAKDDSEVLSHSSVIQGSANYLLSLVENLLDHGRLDSDGISLRFSNSDMSILIQSVALMLKPLVGAKGLDFQINLSANSKKVFYIDSVRIQQCIINIVNNAIKYTNSGSVLLNVDWLDDELIINISDTGIGMSSEEVGNLLTPFWQSNRHAVHGTGLGMTITSKLIELMGGELDVSSTLDSGTEVRFTIPASISDADDDAVLRHAANDSLISKKRVLLVEDDDDVAGLVMLRLGAWGCAVERCDNGLDAVGWLQENSTDIVFMDLSMPGMGGEEAIGKIRENGNRVPIYIMSASPLNEGSDADVDGQVLKPIDFKQLEIILSQT